MLAKDLEVELKHMEKDLLRLTEAKAQAEKAVRAKKKEMEEQMVRILKAYQAEATQKNK